MKRSIEGYLYNRIEKMGGDAYNHVGFEGVHEDFGEILRTIVPEIGMKKKVKITLEIMDD